MPAVAILVLVIAGLVLVSLWRWIDGLALADPGQKDKATAHLDAVKIAASIVVVGGGVFALYLTARRQRTQEEELQVRRDELAQRDRAQAHSERVAEQNRLHAERVAASAEKDATGRQITELFTKAVEQLGHEQAAVRLGGLYTLERLAQDHIEQRRPVVSVLCAYLRMPYLDPDEPASTDEAQNAGGERVTAEQLRARRQELEVRLTVQSLLHDHAHNAPEPGQAPDPTYWGNADNPASDLDVDLTGATLIGLDLTGRRVHPRTNFARANFIGTTVFEEAVFAANARFNSVEFGGDVWFVDAEFTGDAEFWTAVFSEDARFDGAFFSGEARFGGATFSSKAAFRQARFADRAQFRKAKFGGPADFELADFAGIKDFRLARVRPQKGQAVTWLSGWTVEPLPADVAPAGNGDWLQVLPAADVQTPTEANHS